MKLLLPAAAWLLAVMLITKSLYLLIPPAAQYAIAERIGCFGDESVMNAILYIFLSMAVLTSSLLFFFVLRLRPHR
ncbi:hypothetical protein VWV82_004526 [Cronobacter malonaticus]|uniref:hypothetical protein n=1 Tax=Cronobacter malonaticus TaxID=413503 RepID=UPI0005194F61|nr:hypothetical protein [Cronobacter malonaticus]EMD9271542.1 hypothetical protein [Cronobacter malonaticus]EMD9275851.1 hypothetical protein [Cronobacter malonaticus]KIU62746.1 hypothetical protein CRSA0334_12570 [Cronobacter malonaticus ENBT0334]MEB8477138.1 hypothetical protein [Cronobacter malonaticus]